MHHRALLDDFISTTPHYFYFGVNFHWGLVWPGILSAHNAHPTLLLYRNIHWFESYSSSWVSLRHLEVYSVYNIDIRDTVFWSPCFCLFSFEMSSRIYMYYHLHEILESALLTFSISGLLGDLLQPAIFCIYTLTIDEIWIPRYYLRVLTDVVLDLHRRVLHLIWCVWLLIWYFYLFLMPIYFVMQRKIYHLYSRKYSFVFCCLSPARGLHFKPRFS